ncbi:MAG: queuosine precursor transporter [bacterium]
MKNERNVLLVLASIFIGGLTVSNVLAFKLIEFTSLLIAPAGVLAYSITYLMTDVMVEMFGKEKVKFVVYTGFITQLVVLGLIQLAVILPPAHFFKHQVEFALVLSQSVRIIFASLTAFLVSQLWDINVFSWIKRKTKNKHLWIRNNGSTLTSQLLDSIIFVLIAFGGTMNIMHIGEIIIGQYIIKMIIGLLDTPFVYLFVNILKSKVGLSPYQVGDIDG